jgi:hypothetical protein
MAIYESSEHENDLEPVQMKSDLRRDPFDAPSDKEKNKKVSFMIRTVF